MKKLVAGLMLLSGIAHAGCWGPVCYDDKGLYFNAAPALPSKAIASIETLQPGYTNQVIVCSDCVESKLCVSTGTAAGSWVVASGTATVAVGGLIGHCK